MARKTQFVRVGGGAGGIELVRGRMVSEGNLELFVYASLSIACNRLPCMAGLRG